LIHPDEERLTSFCLDLIETAAEREQLKAHLKNCLVCSKTVAGIRSDLDGISRLSVVPLHNRYPLPLRPPIGANRWLKIAASFFFVLIIGGYLALMGRRAQVVEPLQLVIPPIPDSLQVRLAFVADDLRDRPSFIESHQ